MLAVSGALLGAMLSGTVFGDNLTRDNDSPETLDNPSGFATKLYTLEGNWHLMGDNLPVVFSRDPSKALDLVHNLKTSPTGNLQSSDRPFDLLSHVPEATNTLTQLRSGFGIPASYQTMDGNEVHAFEFVNDGNDFTQHQEFGNGTFDIACTSRPFWRADARLQSGIRDRSPGLIMLRRRTESGHPAPSRCWPYHT